MSWSNNNEELPTYEAASSTGSRTATGGPRGGSRLGSLKTFSHLKAGGSPTHSVDVAFLLDITGSMQPWIDVAYDKLDTIISAVTVKWPTVLMRTAFIGYRDYGDEQRLVLKDFQSDPKELSRFIRTVEADGGDDGPEDVLGGMNALLGLSWRSKVRVVLHIADAPAHGVRFHSFGRNEDNYPDGDPSGLKAEDILLGIYEKSLIYHFLKLNDSTDKMVEVFNSISSEYQGYMEVKSLESPIKDFVPTVVGSITSSMRMKGL